MCVNTCKLVVWLIWRLHYTWIQTIYWQHREYNVQFIIIQYINLEGPSWSLSFGGCIYNYLCNQCLSPLKLWVRIPLGWGVLDTILCDKVCQWLVTARWFSLGTPVSTTNKTDCHNITEVLLKVALNTINLDR
jgi:hypothetical protein